VRYIFLTAKKKQSTQRNAKANAFNKKWDLQHKFMDYNNMSQDELSMGGLLKYIVLI